MDITLNGADKLQGLRHNPDLSKPVISSTSSKTLIILCATYL